MLLNSSSIKKLKFVSFRKNMAEVSCKNYKLSIKRISVPLFCENILMKEFPQIVPKSDKDFIEFQ